ncbi:MAG: hypothetical protein V4596_08795 [Bdellovibrionota bacterium]
MKTPTTLTFLITLLIQITSYAATQPAVVEQNLASELSALTEAIDGYFENMIALKTKTNLPKLKITDSHLKLEPEDAEKLKKLAEIHSNIQSALRGYESVISSLESDPESLEIFEEAKLLYNIALVKAFLPRYKAVETGFLIRIISTFQPQYVEEIISRSEAENLIFTNFDTNENLKHRLGKIIETHNKISDELRRAQDANIYQIHPKNLNIRTAEQEAAFYNALVRNEEYSTGPALLTTVKVGLDHFSIIATCAGLFGF